MLTDSQRAIVKSTVPLLETGGEVRISANVTGHFGECDRWAEG